MHQDKFKAIPRGRDCGHPGLDGLARIGHATAILDRLEYLFPLVKFNGHRVWLARRQGDLRRLVEADPAYAAVRVEPTNRETWELLGVAAIHAGTGQKVDPARLYRCERVA